MKLPADVAQALDGEVATVNLTNAPRLEVEHAMIITLRKNGIELPQTIMHVMNGFRPKLPPKR